MYRIFFLESFFSNFAHEKMNPVISGRKGAPGHPPGRGRGPLAQLPAPHLPREGEAIGDRLPLLDVPRGDLDRRRAMGIGEHPSVRPGGERKHRMLHRRHVILGRHARKVAEEEIRRHGRRGGPRLRTGKRRR